MCAVKTNIVNGGLERTECESCLSLFQRNLEHSVHEGEVEELLRKECMREYVYERLCV